MRNSLSRSVIPADRDRLRGVVRTGNGIRSARSVVVCGDPILVGSISHRRINDPGLRGRVEWVDAAKGLGILLVVIGHNLGGLTESGILNNSSWGVFTERYIYIFHMPLFFFLAGIFVARSAHRTFRIYFINKVSVIAYPYFVWSLLEGSAQVFASRFTNNHLYISNLLKIVYQPIDQFWFLYVIFLMYMTYWLVHHRHISNDILLSSAVLIYIVQIFGLNIVRWDVLDSFCHFLIYFALGAKVAETSFLTKLNTLNWICLSCLAVGGYVLIAIFAMAVVIDVSSLVIVKTLLAMLGIIATIALAMLSGSSPIWSSVRIIGVYSLEIYVGHTIFASGARIAMQKAFGYTAPLLHLVVGTAVGISIPVLLAIWGPRVGLPYLFTWSRSRQNKETLAIEMPTAGGPRDLT
jgi:fucose 4-O-acetylase-like acetyltransferase